MANSAWETSEFRGGSDGWDQGLAGSIASLDFFSPLPTDIGGRAQYWTGSVWAYATLKHWTGVQWQTVNLKYWTGSAWVSTVSE